MVRRQRRPLPPGVIGWMSDVPPRAMETRGRHNAPPTRRCCLRLDGETPSARLAMRNKPLRCRPLEGRRDQKSPSVVASSYVPRGVRGSPVSPPAAGRCSGRGPCGPGSLPRDFHPRERTLLSLAAVRPLVRMPTNRHAATGTCEIGQGGRYAASPLITRAFSGLP